MRIGMTTADQSKILLLLIDDDTFLRELLDEELTALGYRSCRASLGRGR
jgi:CheY-like chemotaxis protein